MQKGPKGKNQKEAEKQVSSNKNGKENTSNPLFNIIVMEDALQSISSFRRDCYTFILTLQSFYIREGKRKRRISEPSLFFLSTGKKIAIEQIEKNEGGFVCLFSKEFLSQKGGKKIGNPTQWNKFPFYLELSEEYYSFFMTYFKMIFEEYHGRLQPDFELIALMMKEMIWKYAQLAASEKTINNDLPQIFLNLLQNQFPVVHPTQPITFTTPKDFAQHFGVHINYLNAVLKKEFGKTTTQLIQEMITQEACQLLKFSTWTISDIGKALGFEYPQHFNAYFKKQMQKSPKDFRKENQ